MCNDARADNLIVVVEGVEVMLFCCLMLRLELGDEFADGVCCCCVEHSAK